MRRATFALTVALTLPALAVRGENWPAFRGAAAGGVGNGATPATWDIGKAVNVAWKVPIPGIAFSSPIVWEDRVYVTTAVPAARPRGNDFRTHHVWKLFSLDRASGKVIWEQTAHEGVPYMQRHVSSSYANATPATDGQHIVALLGTEALTCFDRSGRLLWKKLLQVNSKRDAFNSGTSPILVDGKVILQDDRDRDSYIAAYRLTDGQEVWRRTRQDGSSQSTPVIWRGGANARPLLIAVAERSIAALDAATGSPVWSVPTRVLQSFATPALAGDIVISSAEDQVRAFRMGGVAGQSSTSPAVVWSSSGGGGTVSSPLVLGDHVFVLGNGGAVTAYDVRTGRQLSQVRAGTGEFCASPVAADGKIYVFSTAGDATVLRAGPALDVLARNRMGETTIATPAVADGTLYVRTAGHLVALRTR